MRVCIKCGEKAHGQNSYCKTCHAEYDRLRYPKIRERKIANSLAYKKTHRAECAQYSKNWRRKNPVKMVLSEAAKRARWDRVPFTLTEQTLPKMPKRCPVFPWLLLKREKERPKKSSPSLDRIKPKLGYIPENVRWISLRANMLKSDATLKELRFVLRDARRIN